MGVKSIHFVYFFLSRKEIFMNKIKEYTEKIFEDIKHIDENGCEFWCARELQKVLEYSQWRRFENVIEKAKRVRILI